MFYRVYTRITHQGVRIDANGDNLASPTRIQDLLELGLPNTPPVTEGQNEDGSFNIFRDFDTQAQADQWLEWYQMLPSFIAGSVEEVPEKVVATYSEAYLALTPEEQLQAWENCPTQEV
jgi:hypothetical protein